MTADPVKETFLHPYSRPWFAALAALGIAGTILLFRLFPEIDLATSRLFFAVAQCPAGSAAGAVCGSFPLSSGPVVNTVRQLLQFLPLVVALVLLAWTIRAWLGANEDRRRWLGGVAVLGAVLVAPLLIVNGILKAYSGRPRPYSTDLFGGDLPFVPAGKFTDHCAGNCSFVSGEASGAFWLICLVPLVPAGYRPFAFAAALVVAVAASGLRIAFGGHYLSDVLVAALITLLTFSLLAMAAARFVEPKPGVVEGRGVAGSSR